MNNSLTISFSASASSSDVSTWAALEQVDIPESAGEATVSDVLTMVGYAKNGKSARDYIQENCSSLRVVGDVINIDLDFYVWVSSMDLPYTLSVNNSSGSISAATRFTRPTSFNVIFKNTDAVDVGRLFDGTLSAEMPFFNEDGSVILPSPTFETVGPNVVLSEKATTVLRADGTAEGYKHTLTLSLDVPRVEKVDMATGNSKTIAAYSVTGLEAIVTVVWGDNKSDTLNIAIPSCVSALLNACVGDMDGDGDIDIDDLLIGGANLPEQITDLFTNNNQGKQIVWWNTCTGKVIKQVWKQDNE